MEITLYTDGACDLFGENRPGGWAAILQAVADSGEVIKERVISGGAENTTNNQMELTAVIEGLKLLTRRTELTIVTDSLTVIRGASSREKAINSLPLSNEFENAYELLWDQFFEVARGHHIEWEHVRGHSGHELNERCDRLAVKERIKLAKPTSDDVASTDAEIQVYLSTQYSGKAKASAWAAVIIQDEATLEESGLLSDTTELEGTLVGAKIALGNLPTGKSAILYTAQTYLADGMNLWLSGWQARQWKKRDGEPVKYQEHWRELEEYRAKREIHFRFVKSRDDSPHFQRGKEIVAELLNRD